MIFSNSVKAFINTQFFSFFIAYDILKRTKEYKKYVSIMIISYTVSFVHNYFLASMYAGDMSDFTLNGLMVSTCVDQFMTYHEKKYKNDMRNKVASTFFDDQFSKYDKISFSDKNVIDPINFRDDVDRAKWIVVGVINYKIDNVRSIMESLFLCIISFYKTNNISLFCMMVSLYTITYFYAVSGINKSAIDSNNKSQTLRRIVRNKMNLNLPKFQYGQKTKQEILSMVNLIEEHYTVAESKFSDSSQITISIGTVMLCILCIFVKTNIVPLLSVIQKFQSAVIHFLNFVQYNERDQEDFNNFIKILKDKQNIELPEQLTITENGITIRDIHVRMGPNRILKLDNCLTLNFKLNDKILVIGDSGSGKTSFLNAFSGKISGITFEEHSPLHYVQSIGEAYQRIRDTVKIPNLTIRQIFDDEKKDLLIEKCCEKAMLGEWIKQLKNTSTDKNYLDIKFKANASGGETSRLAMAMILHMVHVKNHPIVIFDEPEQGSGVALGYELVRSLVNSCKGKLVFIVSHLPEAYRLDLNWKYVLKIKNDTVRLLNKNETPFDLDEKWFV